MRRTERLFAIAEVLRARRTGITAEELAERFGVSLRTMYRDLDALRAAELPLGAERGRGGGYALDAHYRLPPVNFTAREAALVVALGRHATETRLLPFTDTLGRALDKIRAALSTSAQRELVACERELAFLGVPKREVRPKVRAALEQAWFEKRVLVVQYRDGNGIPSTRRARIKQVLLDRAETRLAVHDLDKGEDRELRVDRIEAAEVEPLG